MGPGRPDQTQTADLNDLPGPYGTADIANHGNGENSPTVSINAVRTDGILRPFWLSHQVGREGRQTAPERRKTLPAGNCHGALP